MDELRSHVITALREHGVHCHRAASPSLVQETQDALERWFPPAYVELLTHSNGFESFFGHYRVFGIGPAAARDALRWNHPDHWKFAWTDRAAPYFCVAEDSFGNQYALRYDEMRAGSSPRVHVLDGTSMLPLHAFDSFEEFLTTHAFRWATGLDSRVRRAQRELGTLRVDELVACLPPVALGGSEDTAELVKMPARAAMITNGDIAIQIEAIPKDTDAVVERFEHYEDAARRTRLRLHWRRG